MMIKSLKRNRNIKANGINVLCLIPQEDEIEKRREGDGESVNNGYLWIIRSHRGESIPQYLHNVLLFGYCTLLVISVAGKLFYKQARQGKSTSLALYDRKSSIMASDMRMSLLLKKDI